ncbi:alpha/beta fold hydrolase [Paracoccus sp. TK19116]|uniref:Alpha/beta fold hydrolase n=1 Tax=Paracoccus albicereus TaxID=2922394 RepID=A0ABT1MVU0_9RHOB|nr:alpha/beta fold hydrolase [Paracoccus albicereus]MCQ0971794.1 alpha/beta fold hydrolase [Paracoccus albicereus]
MKRMLAVLGAIVIGVALVWFFGPREPAVLGPVAVDVPGVEALDDWAASTETDVRPGAERRIVWAETVGQPTDIALVYLHGFSASAQEIAPVPQDVARTLGANLYLARLTGQGQDGAAMATASVADWWRDTAEAIAVARKLGRQVVLIGTSTGATLAAEAARDPDQKEQIAGVVMISPNFRVRNPAAGMLTWPFARLWVPLLAGRERCFQVLNDAHGAAWTSCYPTVSALPMAALVAHASQGDYAEADQPVLTIWSDRDQVVDPNAALQKLEGWGGAVTLHAVYPGPEDDPFAHVVAGDILSPSLNEEVTRAIVDWVTTALR